MFKLSHGFMLRVFASLGLLCGADSSFADSALTPAGSGVNVANSAWVLTATALVLFMTLPGLALFYGGLVRTKNVLSVLMQCFAITCVVTLAWVVLGYSGAFGA